jgi:hypothetical protein
MGLWGGVKLPVRSRSVHHSPKSLDTKTFKEARLKFRRNREPQRQTRFGKGEDKFRTTSTSQPYSLAANEKKKSKSARLNFPKLVIQIRGQRKQQFKSELYQLNMRSACGKFDSRDVGTRIASTQKVIAVYMVNGKKVPIRGGAWVDDLFRDEDEKVETQIQSQTPELQHDSGNGRLGCE